MGNSWLPMPWADLRDEEKHGVWADFAAFEQWFKSGSDELDASWDAIEFPGQSELYAKVYDAVAWAQSKEKSDV
jgi:hypothetical protein